MKNTCNYYITCFSQLFWFGFILVGQSAVVVSRNWLFFFFLLCLSNINSLAQLTNNMWKQVVYGCSGTSGSWSQDQDPGPFSKRGWGGGWRSEVKSAVEQSPPTPTAVAPARHLCPSRTYPRWVDQRPQLMHDSWDEKKMLDAHRPSNSLASPRSPR